MPDLPLPLDFRSELFVPLTARLSAGESVALLGVGSCGKSNVVRFLQRADAREMYFSQDAARTLYTVVDCYKLEDTRDVSVYAAIMAALIEAAPMLGEAGRALVSQFDAWWNEILTADKAAIARRRLEQALRMLFQDANAKRIILLFDDCDTLIAQAPRALFRSLRALRDDHKYQLVYVTVTRRELSHLREMSPDYESFFELLAPHMLALKPYQELDAYMMLKRLAARNAGMRPLNDVEMRNIYRVAGGHAGLTRMTYESVKGTDRASGDTLPDFLASKRVVYDEAQKIWDSLEEYEQQDLLAIVQARTPDHGGVPPLLTKGILVKHAPDNFHIFAPLFERFVQAQAPEDNDPDRAPAQDAASARKIVHDPVTLTVRVNERTVKLPAVESELFAYLHDHCTRACEPNELVNLLMSVESGGQPFVRLQSHLVRLRDRLNTGTEKIVIEYPNGSWQVNCGA